MNIKYSTFLKELIFISAFLTTLFVSAQNKPGGTSLDVELWLKADQLSLANNANVTTWTDLSGNNRDFSQYTANSSPTPSFLSSEMNYNPALNFVSVSGNRQKLVGPNNILNTTKEYYMFYVSRTDNTVGGFKTVLQFNTGSYNPAVGWNSVNAWFTNYANNIITANLPYSINSVFIPNIAATTNTLSQFYINNGPVQTYRAAVVNTGNYPMTIGTGNLTTGNPFIGTISEIIVLSKPKGSGLPLTEEIEKINSYLSIKYGISLDNTTQQKYYSSSNQEIWNNTTNAPYNNFVIGIGRDDKTGLYQKQSVNIDDNTFTIYLGSLTATNKENSSIINADESYVIVGSNNTLGTSPYAQNIGTTFANNYTLSEAIYQRYNKTLKVQKTGTGIGTINLKIANEITRATHVIVSNTLMFEPTSTRIYEINDHIAENIIVNNGDYISFASNIKSPGGSNLTTEIWLKADQLTLSNDTNIITWNDVSGKNRNFTQYSTNPVPTYSINGMNYHPTVRFGSAGNTKLVGPTNINDISKEYYIYTVSYNRSTNYSTLLSFNQERNNSYGWSATPTTPWIYIGGNRFPTNGIGKPYNISAVFNPNRASSTNPLITTYQYLQGIENNLGAARQAEVSTTNRMTLGTSDLGSTWNFTGDISEVIVLSSPKGTGTPNIDDLKKVNSYLSLKYGISIDPSLTPNYYNSLEEIIWNGANNVDYNQYIFGIGRDDLTDFYQKQATNYENNDITIYLNTLENLDKENTGSINSDRSFIILGSNNVSGTTPYIQNSQTVFSNGGTLTTNVNQRYNRILKVSKIGTGIGPIHLKLANEISHSSHVIVSNNTNFSPNETRIYEVSNGIAEDIVLNNNDYISFISNQKAPGGTNLTTEVWLKANDLSLIDGANITTWNDQSIYNRNFNQNANQAVPTFKEVGMNFHSTLNFGSATNTKLIGPTNITDPTKEYYIYYVSNSKSTTTAAVLSFNSELNNSYGWRSNPSVPWLYYSGGDHNAINGIGKPYSINTAFSPNVANKSTYLYVNGTPNIFTGSQAFSTSTTNRMIIGNTNTGTSYPFFGDISEIIVLSAPKGSGEPNTNDLKKVNSYLALKYGINLNPTAQPIYYNSAGDEIWNGTGNTYTNYSNHIFGIGRDDLSDFYQKQATSTETSAVTIYLGNTLTSTNKENPSTITVDRNFLLLGSNGLNGNITYVKPSGTIYSNNNSLNQSTSLRYSRTLKVRKIGEAIGSVNIKLSNQFTYSPYILVSTDTNFNENNTKLYPVVNGIATNVELKDGEYISFVTGKLIPGGTTLETELWLRADFLSGSDGENISTWFDASNYGRNVNQNSTDALPTFLNKDLNYNPSLKFGYPSSTKLVGDYFVEPSKSYYVFYVANQSNKLANGTADNTSYNGIFSFIGNTNHWSTGLIVNKNWLIANDDVFSTVTSANYMVSSAYFPNTNPSTASILNNGVKYDGISTNNLMPASTDTYKTVIGAQRTNSTLPFTGTISEVIVISSPNTGSFNDYILQTQKVNSYLALKYGITLDKDTQPNYYNSLGNPIWTGNINSDYQKDIFAIGRDDLTGFYQKQATSANQNSVTLFLGDLKESNQDNQSTIEIDDNNRQRYIVLGSNGKNDVIDYIASTNSAFSNRPNPTPFYQRFNRTLKVSNTTNLNQENLNLKVDNELYNSSYVIVSNNENFPISNTRIYPVINGIANDLVLNHNDYISFIVADNTPIGLSGFKREIWLIGDNIMTSSLQDEDSDDLTDNSDVIAWNNIADNSNNFGNPSTTPYYPLFNKTAMNFHSSVDFHAVDAEDGGPATYANNYLRRLVSNKDFTPDENRAYFTVIISKLNTEDQTQNANYQSILSLNDEGRNVYGWYQKINPWLKVGGSDVYINNFITNPDSDTRKYGIAISILPNTTSVPDQLYLNGYKNSGTSTTSMGILSGKTLIGNYQSSNGNNNFFGEVLEVMVLSKDKKEQANLNASEIEKLNTYYSLKYGVTLNNAQEKYTLSEGTIAYDTSNDDYNEYTKDIFGIVRDDKSGLYQKQAVSTDSNALTVFLGDLAATNYENTSNLLENNEALILGAKGSLNTPIDYNHFNGFKNNYVFPLVTDPITGLEKQARITKRFEYTYKAKLTSATKSSITVNLAPGVGQYLLVSNNENFLPEATNIYKITGGIINNVTINDGDYIGFAYYAEAPGGVDRGLRMWLNASETETITTNSNNQVLTWTDISGIGTVYKKREANGESATYVLANEKSNFHPTLEFDSRTDYLITDRGPMSVAAPSNSVFYTVINHNFARDRSYFLGYGTQTPGGGNSRRPVFGVLSQSGAGLGRIRSTSATNSTGRLFNPDATMIAGYHWTLGQTVEFEFDAHTETVRHTASSSIMNGVGMLGAGSLTDSYLSGTLPEVIAYENALTNEERLKINSYLGLKYAITLDLNKNSNDVNFDYKYSSGASVWNGNDDIHKNYHNNIASVIRDDNSKLYNRQSKSTDLGDVIHMGIGKSLGVNGDLGKITKDRSALTWGNNGIPFSVSKFGDNSSICGQMDSRIGGKIWLVSPSGNFDQDVILRAAQGSDFPYNGPGWQVYLLIANDPAKLDVSRNEWDQIIPMTYIDGGHQVNYNFKGNTYFTFGAKAIGSCESCDFKGEKQLEFTKATWPTSGDLGPRQFNLGDNFNVEVSVSGATNEFRSRYPRYSSRKSLRERRNGKNEIKTVIKFYDNDGNNEASATYFDLLDIDRVGYKRDDIEVIGYCKGSPVYPTIGYNYNRPERSSYVINPNGKAIGKAPRTPYSGNLGYTNARAMAYVEFENPVDEIHINYKTISTRNTNNTQEIGIGSMNFYCVAPPPPPNEDGLIFTKQATSQVLLCETVDYTFRIINTNCNEKEFTFEDVLPKDMSWIRDSFTVIDPNLSIDPENPDATILPYSNLEISTVVIDGVERQKLTVTGLKAPGGGTTYTLRAKAYFDFPDPNNGIAGAQAGDYYNRASINYERIVSGENVTGILESTDRLTGEQLTKTEALPSERPQLIETRFSIDNSCYSIDKELTVTLNIKNPNTAMKNMLLDFNYDIGPVNYIPGSITISNGISINQNNIYIEDGNISLEDFELNQGESIITLKFKTSDNLNDYLISGTTLDYVDLSFSFDLSNESDEDPCLATTTINSSDEIDLEFCAYCTKPPVGGTALNSDTGVSTLKNTFTNWPSEVPNGFLVLESGKKGMVLTRTKPEDIATPVQGMIIYNTVSKCISIYNGAQWKCIERACNE